VHDRHLDPARTMFFHTLYQLKYTCYVPIILYVSIHIDYIYLNLYICISTFIYIAYNITIYAFHNQPSYLCLLTINIPVSAKEFKRINLSSWTFSTRSLKITRIVNVIYLPFVKYSFEVNTYLIKHCYQKHTVFI
jgi:hypothetical protein